ncbi:MAG: hypothetical protein HYY17_16065 [Planctomycetes bacterium]|nr:hypothetical protein [Planctomycetota bacterium]
MEVPALALETLGFDMMRGSLRPARRLGRGPRRRKKTALVGRGNGRTERD